jgi:hypothetical protein
MGSIQSEVLSGKEHDIINKIHEHLMLIYGLDSDICFQYIGDYFFEQKYIIFEEPVRLVHDYFKNSFN